jgi:hypothetical protein
VLRLHRTVMWRHDHGHGSSVHQFLNLHLFRHAALSLRHHRTLQLLVIEFRRWVYINCRWKTNRPAYLHCQLHVPNAVSAVSCRKHVSSTNGRSRVSATRLVPLAWMCLHLFVCRSGCVSAEKWDAWTPEYNVLTKITAHTQSKWSHTCMVIQRVNRSRACVWFEVLAAVLGWWSSGMLTPCSRKKVTDVRRSLLPAVGSSSNVYTVLRTTALHVSEDCNSNYFLFIVLLCQQLISLYIYEKAYQKMKRHIAGKHVIELVSGMRILMYSGAR